MIRDPKELLGKLVQLAKRGELCEQQLAIKRIQRICKEINIEFDDVMNDTKVEEFTFNYKRGQRGIVSQIVDRFAKMKIDDPIYVNRYRKLFFCKTTKEKYIETLNAIAVLLPAYKKEKEEQRKVIELAFIKKHQLWYFTQEGENDEHQRKPLTSEELRRVWAAEQLKATMKDVQINKAIESPK